MGTLTDKVQNQHASGMKTDIQMVADETASPQRLGQTGTAEDTTLEQFVLAQPPATKDEAVRAYQEKTGAGRVGFNVLGPR